MTPLEILKELFETKQFHHATYRCQGTLWEGLWIYKRSETGFRGFEVSTCINKNDPDLDVAFGLVRSNGISVGSYGNG